MANESDKKVEVKDPKLEKIQAFQRESEDLLTHKTHRASKNLKLLKGIFRETTTHSKVREVDKIFFRKIWATVWRLTATLYQAYMKDTETFRIEGRDLITDPQKAKVLQKICEYRRDVMSNDDSLFLKFIWANLNILTYGWTCGKIAWEYREDEGEVVKDEPTFILYPNDQIFPDMAAETPEKMRYICFLNYITKDEMDEMGWDTGGLVVTTAETTELRETRYHEDQDGLQPTSGNTNYSSWAAGGNLGGNYPTPGATPETEKENIIRRYNIYECFWKEKGKVWYAVTNNFEYFVKKPALYPYKKFPIVWGQCLTEPHKLIGEGFPEPLEAPQETFNYNLNMRKDNLAISLSGHTFVQRGAGVDLQSLRRRRPGAITLTNDLNAIKHEPVPDYTGNSYTEAAFDEAMMDEMSGVTPGKRGMENAQKATVAQINYQESNAKIDLYVGIIGETFFRTYHREMAKHIQLFESDARIFRIANERLRTEEQTPEAEDIYMVDDFDVDCIVNVGPGTVGQGVHVQQMLLAMDRGIMTLQAVPAIAQMGMIPREGLQIPNISKLYEDLLPYIGIRNVKEYLITLPPPQTAPGGGGGSPPNLGGTEAGLVTENELVQQGTAGGI
jgi:hypothetical protein